MAKQKTYAPSATEVIEMLSSSGGYKPPQAIELEEIVLGAIMIERDAIFQVQEILKPESFYKESHRIIYQICLDLSAAHQPIDLYTVGEMLNRTKQLDIVGGANYLASLTSRVGSAAHVEFHSKIIAQKYIQRELITASNDIQRNSFDDTMDVTDLIDYAEAKVFQVSEGNMKRDVEKSYEIVAKAMKQIEEAGEKPDGLSGVPTGFNDLDKLTLGWQPSDLMIIAARPAMGKTAFVLSMARNTAIDFKRPVAFFSLEMSAVQLIMRIMVSESGLDSHKLKSGRLTTQEWGALQKSIIPLQNAPLFIDDTPGLSIFEFRSKARRLKAQHNVELIIIDYLQLMTGTAETRGNREQEVSTISRSLKGIAKELNIPIIALSQLNRSVEMRGGNKRPQLSDLRESGAIEQDADIVAFIHRPDYYGITHDENGVPLVPGAAEIIIAKHRSGPTDVVTLKFRKEQARFTNLDDISDLDIAAEAASGIAYEEYESNYSPDKAARGSATVTNTHPENSFDSGDAPF
ncbi:MAG: replicative DNA helicase [Rikenellaceae bacterium]